MPSKYAVKTFLFESGERFPILIERSTGLPLFDPLVFVLSVMRARNRASATIAQANRAFIVLYLFLDEQGIDLDSRLDKGMLLSFGEIDLLLRNCRIPLEQLEPDLKVKDQKSKHSRNVPEGRHIERPLLVKQIDPESAAIRCLYIRDYLRWLIQDRLLRLQAGHPFFASLSNVLEIVIDAISARIPFRGSQNTLRKREGLPVESIQQLRQTIDPASPLNPWMGGHVRLRNALIIEFFLILGPRRGELLNIKISDINLQLGQLLISRRADDPADPRVNQPCVKTRDRKLPISAPLAQLLQQYILQERRKNKGAKKHEFLFVANGTGSPLTLAGLNKVFVWLRRHCTFLPEDFSPHALRHTWNEEFSRTMDRQGVPEAKEQQMRAYLMGWAKDSVSAATYTKRHIQNKARAVSLDLQGRLMQLPKDNPA